LVDAVTARSSTEAHSKLTKLSLIILPLAILPLTKLSR
jgi:hypothetical protein